MPEPGARAGRATTPRAPASAVDASTGTASHSTQAMVATRTGAAAFAVGATPGSARPSCGNRTRRAAFVATSVTDMKQLPFGFGAATGEPGGGPTT